MDILNSRPATDPYAEYTDESLKEFLLSEFMTTLFNECGRSKVELSKLICQYLNDDNIAKQYGSELFKVYEDGLSQSDQLAMLQEFKANYLADSQKKTIYKLSTWLYNSLCRLKKSNKKNKQK